MKRIAAFVALATMLLCSSSALAEEETMVLQVNSAKLMATPSFLGTPVATLRRGDQLTVQGTQKTWLEVRSAKGKVGWVNKRSVAEFARAELSTEGNTSTGASGDEVELAARGFSKDVEQKYRQDNAELDYRHVDRIERLKVDVDKAAKFAAQAGLGGSAVPAKAGSSR